MLQVFAQPKGCDTKGIINAALRSHGAAHTDRLPGNVGGHIRP